MSNDIFDQLAQDARRLRVARKLPEGQLAWEWVERVRDDFNRFLADTGQSSAKVAKQLGPGFSQAMLSQFRNLKSDNHYIGDRDKLARGINQFMENWARKQEVPKPDGWIETEVAVRMLNIIQQAVDANTVNLIYADAGRGKTMTLEAAASIYAGSIMIRVLTTTKTVCGFSYQVAEALRITGSRSSRRAQARIHDTLKGTDRLLLIDEAHKLTHEALEFVRDIHDVCGIPIVMAGTYKINEACDDRDFFFGQWARRIGGRYDVTESARPDAKNPKPLHSVQEIKKLFHSDKLRLTDDGAVMLTKLSNILGLGGLGLAKQVVLMASRIKNKAPLDAKLTMKILRQMHGETYAVRRIEKAIEDSRLKVA